MEAPMIHKLHVLLTNFHRDILSRFLKPSAFSDVQDLCTISYKDETKHIASKEMFVGESTGQLLQKCKPHSTLKVMSNIKQFYITAVDYIIKRFPTSSKILLEAQVVDINLRSTVTFSSLEYFMPHLPQYTLDELRDGFRRYQTFSLPIEIEATSRMDETWHKLRKWRDPSDGSLPYKTLASAMLGILCIPHSNADAERIFSIVRKNRTESRASMSTNTLESLLINKLGGSVKLSDDILKKCKHATMESLRS